MDNLRKDFAKSLNEIFNKTRSDLGDSRENIVEDLFFEENGFTIDFFVDPLSLGFDFIYEEELIEESKISRLTVEQLLFRKYAAFAGIGVKILFVWAKDFENSPDLIISAISDTLKRPFDRSSILFKLNP